MNLTKSKYTTGIICGKLLWLSIYKKELQEIIDDSVFENGNKVGELARGLFGDYVLIPYNSNYSKMISRTNEEINKNTNIICEASFMYKDNYCAVDILKNDDDGVEIYEVKSSTKISDIYYDDIAYQTWVLEKCGLNVKKSYLVYVNDKYIKKGKLDLNKYFMIKDVSEKIDLDSVEKNISKFRNIINSKNEPNIDLSIGCHKPYDCPFFNYCIKNLDKPNVFDIGWNTKFTKKLEMYNRGNIYYKDIILKEELNDRAFNQVNVFLNKSMIIDKDKIKEFLSSLKYPLYFLDFESYQDAIPRIDGTRPYQQICFQYSLHYYLEKDGELFHKEFLSDEYLGDPMYGLCKRLCEDIPMNSCVLVYNQTFEKARLREMAELYPEFREHLLNIRDNIIDLMIPFFRHYYYVREMRESYSIKYVLPALFPNEASLNYHNLEQVHKGDEASKAFLSLKDLNELEEDKLRDNLLKYCCLDTYAMVKIYEKLLEVIL